MKILILGADGMLGHVVLLYFREKGYVVKGTSRLSNADYYFDATHDMSDIKTVINKFKPKVVVNCIGILNKVAEDNKSLAVLLNSYLPHYVDEICRGNHIKFIQISTDCVFDGKKGDYSENSPKDCTSFYGQSKALGEVDNDSSVTLRTSIVGPDMNEKGTGLFQWFMNQENKVSGFDKVIWAGVTTMELSRCIEQAIKNNLSGIIHVATEDKISKYELLNLFKRHFNKNILITRDSGQVSDKGLKKSMTFDFRIPSHDQMTIEMKDWIIKHKDIYPESQWVSK